ncbi:alpha/beta hydrolase fold-domain-containing protein [Rhodocollybia butyracea]|uniref:Alpha/beta hydrolase fold-domain-containing protein n=1 Tax=Rhodocollybia butyracea TaxID=206335 RepID=A0A9P5P8S8_9AGAR|nr:alpha/beta hydrolase fold-domain-containing protein [Rhodocollybia butyracea]
MTSTERVPKQPLHPSMIPKLDPEYVKFHNDVLQYITPPHTLPWDPAMRNAPTVPGSTEPLERIHRRLDFGTIASEMTFATNMCVRAKCVVLSVNYRLAPEHKYPIAVDDAVESLAMGSQKCKIAVGGSSSGGNLATILALKAAELTFTPPLPAPLVFQLLIVPVTDNMATDGPGGLWEENKHTPWLSPARMNWFKDNYLPNKEDWTKWDASPAFAPNDLLAKTPNAWIGLAEVDILTTEGLQYGVKEVETVVYKGGPHPIMAMDGAVVKLGAQLITDAARALSKAFTTQA